MKAPHVLELDSFSSLEQKTVREDNKQMGQESMVLALSGMLKMAMALSKAHPAHRLRGLG